MTDGLLSLAIHDLRGVAIAIASGRLSPPWTPGALQRFIPSNLSDAVSSSLKRLTEGGFSPPQIATTLRLIADDRAERTVSEDFVEIVTTGPEAPGITNRDTSVVVREMFASANSSVLVVGFAVHRGREVFQALSDRMQQRPALHVRLLLDIQRRYGDTTAPGELRRAFIERFKTREWPAGGALPEVYFDHRSVELSAEKRASLHAKCVVVDRQTAFVSSANFTEAAQNRNIELGLRVTSGSIADRICRHFDALAAASLLQRIL